MISWLRNLLVPVQGTEYARDVDTLYLFLIGFAAFFFLLIAGLIAYFLIRYRRGKATDHGPRVAHHTGLEITWTVIPLIIVMVIFAWGFTTYMDAMVFPADAMEIKVTARKWMFEFEYPNGIRTLNELHLPVQKPVRLIMRSDDVIHSFYVPSFRIKQDVLPGRYTQLWFTPIQSGVHMVLCAEYCGTGHSDMHTQIHVHDEQGYNQWLETGGDLGKGMPLADLGAMLYTSRGCATCHSIDGSRREGPTFQGVFGHPVRLADGSTVVVDENYIRESILEPQSKVVAGFQPIMPTFQGLLRGREVDALVEFIKQQ